jgi:DNA-binding transcriptional ArsR family regulator
MGASKADAFSVEQQDLASLSKALAHPPRIAIIQYLMNVDSCICGDIVNELPLAQPTVSQHLKELKLAGIVKGNIEGNSICYCIDTDKIQALLGFIQSIVASKQANPNPCC